MGWKGCLLLAGLQSAVWGAAAGEKCQHKCSIAHGLEGACGACPYSLYADIKGEDDSTKQTEQLCTPKCVDAWWSHDHMDCLLQPETGAPGLVVDLKGMADSCDTICFLRTGASLTKFKEACKPVFDNLPCPAECKALIDSSIDKGCRNSIVASQLGSTGQVAQRVFQSCGAEYATPQLCDSECDEHLPKACKARCPWGLLALSNDRDMEMDAANLLCSDRCREAWEAPAVRACLERKGDTAKLAALDMASKSTCPAMCYQKAFSLPENAVASADCYALANGNRKDCSPACKQVLIGLGEDCRANTLNGPDPEISASAKEVFTKCDILLPGELSKPSKIIVKTIISNAIIPLVILAVVTGLSILSCLRGGGATDTPSKRAKKTT